MAGWLGQMPEGLFKASDQTDNRLGEQMKEAKHVVGLPASCQKLSVDCIQRFIGVKSPTDEVFSHHSAERLHGERLQLGLAVAKRTIQKYVRLVRPSTPLSPTWATFWKNHTKEVWACDFLPVIDLWFRPV